MAGHATVGIGLMESAQRTGASGRVGTPSPP